MGGGYDGRRRMNWQPAFRRTPILAPVIALILHPSRAGAQGWGNVAKTETPKGFSWTDPLFGGTWMAWTAATVAFFAFIFAAIALMGVLEYLRPGGAPRRGILGLETTRGDRLFIGLLGSAFVALGWLGLMGTPLWGALGLAVLWIAAVFWKV